MDTVLIVSVTLEKNNKYGYCTDSPCYTRNNNIMDIVQKVPAIHTAVEIKTRYVRP